MMRLRILTLILFFLASSAGLWGQGLLFNGMEAPIEKRTSYDVFVSRTPDFNNTLKIEFSFAIYHPSDFGYILRVKNQESGRIFNLLYSGEGWNSSYPLRLNEEGKSSIIKADLPHGYFKTGEWIRISLEFKMKEGKIRLLVDDFSYETTVDTMPLSWKPVINFGKSDYMIDVPSMAIKDLVIEDGSKRFHFPLSESEGTKVKENNRRIFGKVSNPQWLVCKSYNWEEVASFKSKSKAGVNYDKYRKTIMYYNTDTIKTYNLINKDVKSVSYSSPCPIDIYLGSSFVNPFDNELYLYEAHNLTADTATVASFNIEQNQWSIKSSDTLPTRFHHHSSYLDEARGKLVIFGGFGDMAYNGDFYSFDLKDYKWRKEPLPSGSRIHPRYFTSLGYEPNEDILYVFGGMGNESGEQIVGRHYFYDLYKVDLNTEACHTVWGKEKSLNWQEENMVPVRNMIVEENGFYTMCYPEFYTNSHLQLFHFDIESASYTKLCNQVPIRSDKMSTNANLYFDKDLRLLILTIMESSDDIQSQLKVYTLSFPPLTESEYQRLMDKTPFAKIIIGCILILGVSILLIISIRRRKRKKAKSITNLKSGRKRHFVEQKPNSICLFGGFSALDVNGKEVSFPYQQKKLLCLILKYSMDSGISSNRLSKIMWPDKTEEKVKNSRGVAINHLRRLLENFNGVSLIFENSHFKIHTYENFFCDWIEFKKESVLKNPDVNKIMSIVSRGKFLPFIEDPVFDTFKENTESILINILSAELMKSYGAKQYLTVVDIADVISYTDPLNEQALSWQLNALVKLKRTEDALVRYAAFIKEYKVTYDADYEHDFKSLIK